jgi:hypothetical protein
MKSKTLILLISISLLSCKNNYKSSDSEKEQTSEITIEAGSGKFIVEGGFKKAASITIH